MARVNTYNGVKYLLEKEIKRGRLLDTRDIPRGIGKSKILLDIAQENGYVIAVDVKTRAKGLAKDFGVEDKGIYVTVRELDDWRGKELPKGVLFEEGLTVKQENKLKKMFNVIGGYSNDI